MRNGWKLKRVFWLSRKQNIIEYTVFIEYLKIRRYKN